MGRQWLHAKREVAGLKKGQLVGKLVKEIMVAAKLGGAEPASNPRLAAVVDKARKASVTRDVIERAIKKGAGIGDDKLVMEHVVFEGYAPNKVPIIVEILTDNNNRTAPEIRVLFKKAASLALPAATNFFSTTSAWSKRTMPIPGRTSKRRRSKPARRMSNRFPTRRTTIFRRSVPGRVSSLSAAICTRFRNGWPQMDGPSSRASWVTSPRTFRS